MHFFIYFEDNTQEFTKFTRLAISQAKVEVMNMKDMVPVKRNIMEYVQSVRRMRN